MRSALAEAAIEDGRGSVWLLTLTLPDGRAVRVATEQIEVLTAANLGGPFRYDPLIVGVEEFEEEVDYFGLEGAVSLTQARVDLVTSISLAALTSDWQHLSASTVELALIWPGERYHDRTVLLLGVIQAPSWGRAGEISSLTLEATPEPSSAVVGDASRDVGADFAGAVDTAGDEMSDLDGAQYQVILGTPRSVPAYKVGDVGAAGFNRLVLCGHALESLAALTVTQDAESPGSYVPIVQSSGTGAPYTYVQSAIAFSASHGAYTWVAATGGVARADGLSVATRSAADVLRYLLTQSGLVIDWGRTERALQLLAGWSIGLYVDEEAPAIAIIREQLLPWLPLIELRGGTGTWFGFADPFDLPIEARLVMGQGLVGRIGGMEVTDRDAVRNSFSVAYGRDEYLDEFAATVVLDADTDALCALSAQLYGTLQDDPRECPISWDATTVRRMARHSALRLALPRRRLRYLAAPDLYWLRSGMGITLTDADYAIDEARAVVRSIRRGGVLEVVIEVLDAHPVSSL